MLNIHTVMPLGNRSRGYDRKTEEEASEAFQRMVTQIRAWKNYTVDVVMTDEDVEVQREHIHAA